MSNKQVQCKNCKSFMMPQEKVCSQCGTRKKSILLSWWLWMIILAMIIAAIMICGKKEEKLPEPSSSSMPESSSSTSEAPAEPAANSIGDTVKLADVNITFEGVTEYAGSKFNMPGEGNVFIVAEFTIKNTSKKEMVISSLMSFETTVDAKPVKQKIMSSKETGKGQLDGVLGAGKKITGVIVYEVPMGYKEVIIKYKPNITEVATFAYNK